MEEQPPRGWDHSSNPGTCPVGQWWKLSPTQCLQGGDSQPWGKVSHFPEIWGWKLEYPQALHLTSREKTPKIFFFCSRHHCTPLLKFWTENYFKTRISSILMLFYLKANILLHKALVIVFSKTQPGKSLPGPFLSEAGSQQADFTYSE